MIRTKSLLRHEVLDSKSLYTIHLKVFWGWTVSLIGSRKEKIYPRQVISDGQTDGETDHYRVSAD